MISTRKKINRFGLHFLIMNLLLGYLVAPSFGEEQFALKAHEANYKVDIKGFTAELKTSLKTSDGVNFFAEDFIKTTGVASVFLKGTLTSTSKFFVEGYNLKPNYFYSLDTLSKEKKRLTLDFDWVINRVNINDNEKKSTILLNNSIKDRLTLKYALMMDLLGDQLQNQYSLYENDKIKKIKTTNLGTKVITIDHGVYEVIGIQNQASGSSKLSIFWCAEKLGFLPVLIEQYRDNKLWLSASLSSYKEIV
jgi:hypothetical protein|tara:strand:- start:161 stop:910 length:750 start_codon:yes stop_codon:yes gene_type:complete